MNYLDLQKVKLLLYDLSIGVFASMVLVWTIDETKDRIQRKEENKKRIRLVSKYNSLLQPHISKYIELFCCVVTPTSPGKINKYEMPDNIELKDMYRLYDVPMGLEYGVSKSAVECFLEAEAELSKCIVQFLSSKDLDIDSDWIIALLEFVEVSLEFKYRHAIMDVPNHKVGQKPQTEIIKKLLIHDSEKYYSALQDGTENKSHQLYPYVELRNLMLHERKLILNYQDAINLLEKKAG